MSHLNQHEMFKTIYPFKICFENDKGCQTYLDAETIEVFTFEKFNDLLISCAKDDKDFIIARVTTQDPFTGIIFYNYYSAIELNVILFCIENGVLYRVRTKNPVNNLNILGKVFYYRITPEILKSVMNISEKNIHKEMLIKAEYFASDEDLIFDESVREYFRNNSKGFHYNTEDSNQRIEEEYDSKFSLKLILYTNILTIILVFGICLFIETDEVLLSTIIPLTLTLLLSVSFLGFYTFFLEDK